MRYAAHRRADPGQSTSRSRPASAVDSPMPPPPCACCAGPGGSLRPRTCWIASLSPSEPMCRCACAPGRRACAALGRSWLRRRSCPRAGCVLVNPGVPLSTVAVFRARAGGFSPGATLPDAWGSAQTMAADLSGLTNDLEAPAISLVPAIRDVLRAIAATNGCLLARMSGSGATCFGLFAGAREAAAAAAELARPGWWSWAALWRATRCRAALWPAELCRAAAGAGDRGKRSSRFTRSPSRPITGWPGRVLVGRRQVVRQRILIPSFGGSSPPAPAMDIAH